MAAIGTASMLDIIIERAPNTAFHSMAQVQDLRSDMFSNLRCPSLGGSNLNGHRNIWILDSLPLPTLRIRPASIYFTQPRTPWHPSQWIIHNPHMEGQRCFEFE